MKNRQVGYLIIGIALLIGFIIYLFNRALTDIVSESCSHGPSCPMWGTINFQTNVSIGVMVFVVLVGVYIISFVKDAPIKPVKPKVEKESYTEAISAMSPDEKSVFNKILDSDGSIFQSDILKDSELTKVKLTRILDRLEGKGLIERKRRGMANIVLLKHT